MILWDRKLLFLYSGSFTGGSHKSHSYTDIKEPVLYPIWVPPQNVPVDLNAGKPCRSQLVASIKMCAARPSQKLPVFRWWLLEVNPAATGLSAEEEETSVFIPTSNNKKWLALRVALCCYCFTASAVQTEHFRLRSLWPVFGLSLRRHCVYTWKHVIIGVNFKRSTPALVSTKQGNVKKIHTKKGGSPSPFLPVLWLDTCECNICEQNDHFA